MTRTIRKRCILEKWSGKGGWTFARVPEIPSDKKAPFVWVKVKGRIDSFELKQYRLMPMGDGTLHVIHQQGQFERRLVVPCDDSARFDEVLT